MYFNVESCILIFQDTTDLKVELARKEELLKRHHEKIAMWQNLLADLQGWGKSPVAGGAQGPAGSAPGPGPGGPGIMSPTTII